MYQPEHEEVYELMKGAYDLHMHPSPDVQPRKLNDVQAMEMADAYGMAGIVIKNHMDPTMARASLLNESGKYQAKAYGGIVLNLTVGGLNPEAVKNALETGAKIVWMPTVHARNHVEYNNFTGIPIEKSIRIVDEEDHLKPEVYEILDLVKAYDAVLATGHLSMGESIILCSEGRKRNVRMVLTHPDWGGTFIPVEVQKRLADMGVYIEKLWYDVGLNLVSISYMAETIRENGVEHCYL